MSRAFQLLFLLSLVAVVAVTASLATLRWLPRPVASGVDQHQRIHHQLGLTQAQQEALEPIETLYLERKRQLEHVLNATNAELARAIREDRGDSARVQGLIRQLHEAMGQLQAATLDHVFAMKAVLTPTQYEQLLDLTARALAQTGNAH